MIEMTPLFRVTPNAFVNLSDGSALLQFVTQNDIAENVLLLGAVNLPVGPDGTEFWALRRMFRASTCRGGSDSSRNSQGTSRPRSSLVNSLFYRNQKLSGQYSLRTTESISSRTGYRSMMTP